MPLVFVSQPHLHDIFFIVHSPLEGINSKQPQRIHWTYSDEQFSEQFKTESYDYCNGNTNICMSSHLFVNF